MNNAEWVIENEPELFDLFDCPQCSRYDGEKCTRPDGADFDETECAKGHVEWLMQPHGSSLEAAQTGDCDKDEREPAKEVDAPVTDADSRERLEADAVAYCDHFLCTHQRFNETKLIELLDRQAAITRRETVTECDRLEEENAPETPDFVENPQKTPENATQIVAKDGKPIRIGETLTGEDGIAWTVQGFDRDSDYSVIGISCLETRHFKPEWLTHKVMHICDTCRYYTRVSDGTGDCRRYPREVEKCPDDWCGEWSE